MKGRVPKPPNMLPAADHGMGTDRVLEPVPTGTAKRENETAARRERRRSDRQPRSESCFRQRASHETGVHRLPHRTATVLILL